MKSFALAARGQQLFGLTAILSIALACSGAEPARSVPAASPTPASHASPSPTLLPTASPTSSPTIKPPATKPLDGQVVGAADTQQAYPSYSVQAPAGWSSVGEGGFMVKEGPAALVIGVWDPVRVPSDPCLWQTTMMTPGPTVDDLVQKLLTQRVRDATIPHAVTLAGHEGVYFEWSVPEDAVVTGEDASFRDCDSWPGSNLGDFVSWQGAGDTERYHQFAGQIDQLWILDVDGQRLVVDASSSPDATAADRAELQRVVESLQFEEL